MRKNRFYYHVTDLKNVDQIKEHGLKANKEGLIFVFTDMVVSGLIAKLLSVPQKALIDATVASIR